MRVQFGVYQGRRPSTVTKTEEATDQARDTCSHAPVSMEQKGYSAVLQGQGAAVGRRSLILVEKRSWMKGRWE